MISSPDVTAFKTSYCDENPRIATLLRERFAARLPEPILDVGAGLGDIAVAAFPTRHVFQLEPLEFVTPMVHWCHVRVKGGFFEYSPPPGVRIQTILFCHVLQFLDDDVVLLADKVRQLSPEVVVIVENENDGLMGNLLAWSAIHLPHANPEVALADFPPGFTRTDSAAFSATVSCPDFDTLAVQVAYLLDANPLSEAQHVAVRQHLRDQLDTPSFQINQRITAHRRT